MNQTSRSRTNPANRKGKRAGALANAGSGTEQIEDRWAEFASFVVYFEKKNVRGVEQKRTVVQRRTSVHHVELDEQSTWSGIAMDEICTWIQGRLSALQDASATSAGSLIQETGGASRGAPRLSAGSVNFVQPPDPNQQPLNGLIRSKSPLLFRVQLQWQDEAEDRDRLRRSPRACHIFAYAQDIESLRLIRLGMTLLRFASDQDIETFETIEFRCDGLYEGTYRLTLSILSEQSIALSREIDLGQICVVTPSD
jgi:hypothetical protein